MPKSKQSINLLPHQKNFKANDILNWALSIGRFIVIVTEIVALLAFILRFPLDAKRSDLDTKIKQQEVYINFFSNDEKKYRNLQSRLALASTLSAAEDKSLQNFFLINSLLPSTVTLTAINQTSSKIEIDLSLTDVTTLKQFSDALTATGKFTKISIDKISKSDTQGVLATVSFIPIN